VVQRAHDVVETLMGVVPTSEAGLHKLKGTWFQLTLESL
jgi:hypothetical protein